MVSALPPFLRRLSWPPRPSRREWIFALRTTAAGLVALYVSLALGLGEPQWSIMTVFIVAQPFTGMVLAKGFYRIVGSLVGAGAAMLLVRVLAPYPFAFLLAMALWLALCTFVSGLLRNASAYGAVLAGYTAGIIAYPAMDYPPLLMELAVGRCGEILVGIVCAGLASAFILPQHIRPALQQQLQAFLRAVAGFAAGALDGATTAALHTQQRGLIAQSQTLDALRAYGLAETPGLRNRGRQVRHVLGHLLSAISTARTLHAHVDASDPHIGRLMHQAAAALRAVAADADPLGREAAGRPAVAELEAAISAHQAAGGEALPTEAALRATTALIALADLTDAMMHALAGLGALVATASRPPPPADGVFATHRDPTVALRNAARAGIAALLIGLLWRVSNWPEGAGVVAIVAALTGLFAALPRPATSVMTFFRGTLYATPFAYVAGQLVLPRVPGFAPLAVVLAPVLVAGGIAMARPRTLGIATGFVVMFLAMLSPRPVMAADLAAFLNIIAAVLGGILLCVLVFKLILPVSPRRDIAQLGATMRADLARLCRGGALPGRLEFESRMYDRMNRVLERVDAAGGDAEAALGASAGALTIGIEILRLRGDRAAPPLSPARRDMVERELARLAAAFAGSPSGAAIAELADRVRAAALDLMRPDADAPMGHPAQAAALRMIAVVMTDHAGFFVAPTAERPRWRPWPRQGLPQSAR